MSGLDHQSLWRNVKLLQDRLFSVLGRDQVLDECLDIVVDLLAADRGLLLTTRADGSTMVVSGRRQGRALTPSEREAVSKTIIHEAQASRRPVLWDPLSGDSTESIAQLGIGSAVAAPLYRRTAEGREVDGVIYVDFRGLDTAASTLHLEFLDSAAVTISAILDQHRRRRESEAELLAGQTPVSSVREAPLEELLGFRSLTHLRAEAEALVQSEALLLVLGESGTGKTLLAHAIAAASGRRPIVRAVLGTSDDLNTITSELFGHVRGAFSGANGRRVGLVEHADGGSLLLDEILNLPPHAQQLLLDFTQFGTYRPLGYEGVEPRRSQARIIASTNGDLEAAVRAGRFREDLYYRLAGAVLELPPLRRRREDIPSLAESVLRRADPERRWQLSVDLRRTLLSEQLTWPGNVRQLEAVILRARDRTVAQDPEATTLRTEQVDLTAAGSNGAVVAPAEGSPSQRWAAVQTERARLEARERAVIEAALAAHDGVVAHAARDLGMARTTLASRVEALGLGRRGKGTQRS